MCTREGTRGRDVVGYTAMRTQGEAFGGSILSVTPREDQGRGEIFDEMKGDRLLD